MIRPRGIGLLYAIGLLATVLALPASLAGAAPEPTPAAFEGEPQSPFEGVDGDGESLFGPGPELAPTPERRSAARSHRLPAVRSLLPSTGPPRAPPVAVADPTATANAPREPAWTPNAP